MRHLSRSGDPAATARTRSATEMRALKSRPLRDYKYYPAPDPENPGADPIWGWYAVMLKEGGDWAGKPGQHDRLLKPRKREFYPGECLEEPDPEVSNKSTTAKLIAGMRQHGWSRMQVHHALSDPAHVGGAYYRWRRETDHDPEIFVTFMYDGSYTAEQRDAWIRSQRSRGLAAGIDPRYLPKTPRSGRPVNTDAEDRISKAKPDQWKRTFGPVWRIEQDGLELGVDLAGRVLVWVRREGPVSTSQVRQSGTVKPRLILRYIEALVDAGLLTKTTEKHLCPNGRRQTCNVLRVADADTAALVVSAENLPEQDRPLWECLMPIAEEPRNPLTLAEFLDL